MQKVLRKRVLREFRENLFRYIALFLLIVLGMYLVVSLVAAAESIIIGTDRFCEAAKSRKWRISCVCSIDKRAGKGAGGQRHHIRENILSRFFL